MSNCAAAHLFVSSAIQLLLCCERTLPLFSPFAAKMTAPHQLFAPSSRLQECTHADDVVCVAPRGTPGKTAHNGTQSAQVGV